MNESCESCRFYQQIPTNPGGWCRRHPPTAISSKGLSTFPRVAKIDWCGEWEGGIGKSDASKTMKELYPSVYPHNAGEVKRERGSPF